MFDGRIALRRGVVVTLLVFQFASTVMELFSLFILMPVFQFIQANGDVASLVSQYRHWRILTGIYEALGVPTGLATLLCTSFVFLLARQAFVYGRLRYQAWARETTIATARANGFRQHLFADIDYQENAQAGGVVNDLTTDLLRAMDHLFGQVFLKGMLVVAAVYTVSLFALSVTMTITALIVFGLALFALRGPMRQAERVGGQIAEANQKMSSFLVERLHQTRLVRLAGMEKAETEQMDTLAERQRGMMVTIFALLAKIEIIMEPIVICAAFLFIYFSVTAVGMRLEEIGLFLVMVMRLLPVVKEAARTRQSNRASLTSYKVISNRFAEATAAREKGGGTEILPGLHQELRFHNVVFAYGEGRDKAALNGIDLTIPAGEITALVGPSGAGKSTLLDMIPRLRHPQSGTIEIDGTDIERFTLESLRQKIAYAPQTPQVFNVSVAEHIRYGKADATVEEIRAAAELAGALAFIEAMPDGFDTVVGEKGSRLSGGQRQRLDLARALVGKAPILLLDEPTSNLDAESEEAFRDALRRIREKTDTTVMIIAHRLSTVMRADQIAVVEDGRITGSGTHAELVKANPWYANAFAKQRMGAPEPQSTRSAAE